MSTTATDRLRYLEDENAWLRRALVDQKRGMPLSAALPHAPNAPEEGTVAALPPLISLPVTWAVVWGFWTFATIVTFSAKYLSSFLNPDGPIPFWRAADRITYNLLWAVGTLVAIAVCDSAGIQRLKQYGRIILVVLSGIPVALGWSVAAYYLNVLFVPGWVPLGVDRMIMSSGQKAGLIYWEIVCLVHGILYIRRYRLREVQMLQAELQLLKIQLQPHFLFNAMHSIAALMRKDIAAAQRMLVLLSDMLRHSLATVKLNEVRLQDEIAALELYLEIEQVRFQDRLRVEWDLDPETSEARFPHMVLQPVVENAVKHGIAQRSRGGTVRISSRRRGNHLVVEVWDDGPGLRASAAGGTGVGLRNNRHRMAQLYGPDQSLELAEAPAGGTIATIVVPFGHLPPSQPHSSVPWTPRMARA